MERIALLPRVAVLVRLRSKNLWLILRSYEMLAGGSRLSEGGPRQDGPDGVLARSTRRLMRPGGAADDLRRCGWLVRQYQGRHQVPRGRGAQPSASAAMLGFRGPEPMAEGAGIGRKIRPVHIQDLEHDERNHQWQRDGEDGEKR